MALILIVDDDALIRSLFRSLLGEAGYETTEAWDGADGMCAYRFRRPDVVIIDLFMPDRSGLEMMNELLEMDREAKIVMTTGGIPTINCSADFLSAATMVGAKRILKKPFTKAALLEAVSGILKEHAQPTLLPHADAASNH